MSKCTHPNRRTFTFSDGKVIEFCPDFTVVQFKSDPTRSYKVPCTLGDATRAKLFGSKRDD